MPLARTVVLMTDATIAGAYGEVRARMLELADDIEPDADRQVPACPEWSVKDVYAHLTGVADDALEGRLDGVATDSWTERQVSRRRSRSFREIVEEWRRLAPMFQAGLDALGENIDPRLIIDIWTHEQDVRGAVSLPDGRSGHAARLTLTTLVAALASAVDVAALPAIRWTSDREVRTLGSASVGIELTCSDYEFARARMGRRSRTQITELGWSADPEPWLSPFITFGPAERDVWE